MNGSPLSGGEDFGYFFDWVVVSQFHSLSVPSFFCQDGFLAPRGLRYYGFDYLASRKIGKDGVLLFSGLWGEITIGGLTVNERLFN